MTSSISAGERIAPFEEHRRTERRAAAQRGLPGRWIYGMFAASLIAALLLLTAAHLTIAWSSRSNIPYLVAAAVAIGLRTFAVRGGWRGARALGECAEYFGLFAAVALMGAVTSYSVAALTHGYADAALQQIDVALGFDWLAWYRLVAAHRALQALGQLFYQSIYFSPAILLGWFAARGKRRDAHRFLAAFWFAAVLTLALFSLMPAVGPFSYLWHAPIRYMPLSELWQPNLIPALREHHVTVIDLGTLRGLVSAPSFHTAAATLYIATAWRLRRLRWPLTLLNTGMLIATPVEGTHYLADMLIGAAVAVVALLLSEAVLPRRVRTAA